MAFKVNEEKLYPVIANWLQKFTGCHVVAKRRKLWSRQPDVLGIKFNRGSDNKLIVELHLVEAKIIDSLESAYNLIGEMEVTIARFKIRNSAFHMLYPYLALLKGHPRYEEVENYADHRGIGIIEVEDLRNTSLSLMKSPRPLFSNKTLSIDDLGDEGRIKDKDEAKIVRMAVKTIGWWRLKRLVTRGNLK